MDKLSTLPWLRRLALLPALLLGLATAALAQDADPPGRVATMTQTVGSVVFAPEGEDEWTDLPQNRPLTRGDRIWTDQGARAELHMGSAALHMDSQSHLAFFELDDDEAQLSLTQGTINMRVRDLAQRENMEVDTPNLAVRAMTPGDFRVDVDPAAGTTRVVVRSGEVAVFGERGQSLRLSAGQQMTFAERDLEQVRGRVAGADDFDQWAADLNRREDQSVTARYVPRGVVGYAELDTYGTWDQDVTYGPVWYPRVTVTNWAPYRYGHWAYIRPWGWTWVDEAPWGFAPFHYGRWALIGTRWAWVPGSFGPRPVYSPALVAFVGGGSGVSFSFSIGSGPGIGWYPLGPGEAWYPTYRTTNVYVTNVNRNIVLDRNQWRTHANRRFERAITAMRVEDFNRGVSVRDHWRQVRPGEIGGASITTALPRPDRGLLQRGTDLRAADRGRRLIAPPPAATTPLAPSRNFGAIGGNRDAVREERREDRREGRREDRRERGDDARRPFVRQEDGQGGQGGRERFEQQRVQQERSLQERAQQERAQQERAQRDQERALRERERAQREQEQRVQRDQERNQREQQRAMQEQRERQQRAQQEAQDRQREQAARQQQERAQRDAQRDAERQQREQQRALREQQRAVAPQQQERPPPQVSGHGRGFERARVQEAEDNRGRGQGGGRFQKQDDDGDDKRGRGRGG